MFDRELAAVDPHADEAALITRIAELERTKSTAAAGQARAAAALDALRCSNEADAGLPAAQRGRGVASEIALGTTGFSGSGREAPRIREGVGVRNAAHSRCVEAGRLSEWRATLIVRESACLDVDDRRALDAELCAEESKLDGMGDARIVAAARGIATGSMRRRWWIAPPRLNQSVR